MSEVSDDEIDRLLSEGAERAQYFRDVASNIIACASYVFGFLTAAFIGWTDNPGRWFVPGLIVGCAFLVALLRSGQRRAARRTGEPR